MNQVKIKLNPYKNTNLISLNDKPLSLYSELSNYLKEPFLKWVHLLYESIERELNDDYVLTVSAEPFETEVLRLLSKENDSCVEFVKKEYEENASVKSRIEQSLPLVTKYSEQFSLDEYKLPVYFSPGIGIEHELCVVSKKEKSSVLVVSKEEMTKEMFPSVNKEKLVVCLSNCTKISVSNGFVWEVTSSQELINALDLITERYVLVPYFVELTKILERHLDKMPAQEKYIVQSSLEVDRQIYIDDIQPIEVGSEHSISFKGAVNSSIRIVSLNPNVIQICGISLKAKSAGKAVIEFYKADAMIPFEKKEVSTYQNNYIKRINLSIDKTVLKIGEVHKIHVEYLPADAEDIETVNWSVTGQNECIELTPEHEVIAKNSGKAVVTVKSKTTDASVEIEVLPDLKYIALSDYDTQLFVGQTKPIQVKVQPENCFDSTYHWETSDKSVAVVERDEFGKEFIKATGIGTCILKAKSDHYDVTSADIHVLVESSFKNRENNQSSFNGAVIVLAALTIICKIFDFTSILTLILPISLILVSGYSILKYKSEVFWVILLTALALWIYF